MCEAIFLSAGVPDPRRGAQFAATADSVAITSAVSAIVSVTLGRRLLVWGGHPAITPMIWVVAHDIGIDYGSWVRLYQSRYFQDEFPQDNDKFHNVIYVNSVENDREKSLLKMRERMFMENRFKAAVFIGGMGGVIDEFRLFKRLQTDGRIVPIASTGGAALQVASEVGLDRDDLANDLDYIALLHRQLDISPRERRYRSLAEQPQSIAERFWHP